MWAKIALDADDYEKGVKSAMDSGEELEESFEDITDKSTTLTAKVKVLGEKYNDAKADVQRLTGEFNKSVAKTGAASSETRELAEKLDEAERKAEDFRGQLVDATEDLRKYGSEADDAATSTGNIGGAFSSAKKIFSTGSKLVVGGAVAIGGALAGAAESTEEYRIAQGKLNTAFENAGYAGSVAKNTYSEFYKILGDTDQATEASQLLSNMGLTTVDLAKFTDIAAGVYGTFGDSLPIESLIEAANETAKTGQVTGSFADALNWGKLSTETFGVALRDNTEENKEWNKAVSEAKSAEDYFNLALQECSTEQERQQLILNTLESGYKDASKTFRDNNKSILENRDSQLKLQDAMADLGGAASEAGSVLLEKFTPYIADAAKKAADFLRDMDVAGMADTFITKVGDVGGAISDFAGKISDTVTDIDGVTKSYDGLFTSIKKITDSGVLDDFSSEAVDAADATGNAASTMEAVIAATNGIAGVVDDVAKSGVLDAWDGDMVAMADATGGAASVMDWLWGEMRDVASMDGTSVSIDVETGEASKNVSGLQKQLDELKKRDGSTIRVNVAATGNTGLLSMKDPKNPTAVKNAGGMDYVPYNDFPSMLHQGEMVLTKPEADTYRRRGNNGGQIVINQYIQSVPQTAVEFAAATEAYFEQARWAI